MLKVLWQWLVRVWQLLPVVFGWMMVVFATMALVVLVFFFKDAINVNSEIELEGSFWRQCALGAGRDTKRIVTTDVKWEPFRKYIKFDNTRQASYEFPEVSTADFISKVSGTMRFNDAGTLDYCTATADDYFRGP